MAANTDPVFTDTARFGIGAISTANTSRTAPADGATIATAGVDGTLVKLVRVVATGTTTAGVVRIFQVRSATYYLLKEILVTAITPSTTVEVFVDEWTPTEPLVIPSGDTLYATTHNAEAFRVFCWYEDY